MHFQDWIWGGIGQWRLRFVLKLRDRASLWRKGGSCFKFLGFAFWVCLDAWELGSGYVVLIVLCRKVVEHACLLKAEQVLSDEDEQETLDYLYAFQYQMRGIAAVSLGHFLFHYSITICGKMELWHTFLAHLALHTVMYMPCFLFL